MSEPEEPGRAELIEAVERAARIARAQAVRRLLRTLLRRRRDEDRLRRPAAVPSVAASGCR